MTAPRRSTEPFPAFVDLWEEICLESARPGTTVLVEGERDRAALRALGLPGPITLVHHGRPLAEVAAELDRTTRRVIVLTDWDTEGGHLAQRLAELLGAGPVEVDLELRKRLARVLRGELVHVEGLHGWARRGAEAEGGPLDHFLRPARA